MVESERKIHWQAPPFTSAPEDRFAWVEDQIREGEGWLEGQPAYKNLKQNMATFDAVFSDKTRSTLVTNELKYDIRKFVETLSDVKEIGGYGSDAPYFKQYAEMINRCSRGVYLESSYPAQIRKVLQYATVMGVGYLWPKCHVDDYGFGERKLVFEALGPLDVVPVQVPLSGDVQGAYNTTIYSYLPVAEAHGRFSKFQSSLLPVDKATYKSRIESARVDFAERFRYGSESRNFGNLYCEIRYTFVRDLAINRTGKELPMGEEGTTWFYRVPFVGQMVPGPFRNGAITERRATALDARIYPYLRLIITARGMTTPMYDGPAYDWHGKIPLSQYVVDDWAWEQSGRSLVEDVASIERTKRKTERKMDQVITATLNPPLGYDRTSTGGPKIENFDIFEDNVRAGLDGEPTKVMQSLLPEEVRVTEVHFKWLEYLSQERQKQLGLLDLGNLQNMKMNIASDTADKMLEEIGPVAKGIAGRIEEGNKRVGYMLKFMILQWFDTARIMEYVPPESMAPQVFDFDPSSMVPSHMPDELGPNGSLPESPSRYDKLKRARWFAKNIRLISVPNTLLQITQMQEQLKWLQLKRGNAPISWATTLKKLGIENYGDVPGNTERERWFNEELEMQKMKIMAAVMAQKMMMEMGMQPPPDQQQQHAPGPGSGGNHGGGRPPSGKKPPRIEQKGAAGGVPRTTITES